MLRGDRDLRTAPGHAAPALFDSSNHQLPARCLFASLSPCALRFLVVALVPFFLTGCQSFVSPLATWRAAYDGNLVKGPTKDEMADVSSSLDTDSLLDRWLTPRKDPSGKGRDTSSTLILGSDGWKPMAKPAKDPAAEAEFNAAHTLFEQGKLAEAEKEFARIAKKRKGSPQSAKTASIISPRLNSSGRSTSRLTTASSCFTRTIPRAITWKKLVAREYEIAQLWFMQDDPKAPKEKLMPWYGRFDGRLPLFDVQGSALKALEHVRQNDPSGPLADTASKGIARLLYEASRLRFGRHLLRSVHAGIPQEPLSA